MERNGSIRTINERLARRIRREGKKPDSEYANKFVGIVNGEVVVVAHSLNEVSDRLREIEPDASKCYIVDFEVDFDQVYEV